MGGQANVGKLTTVTVLTLYYTGTGAVSVGDSVLGNKTQQLQGGKECLFLI